MGTYLTNVEKGFFLKTINLLQCNLVCDVGAGAGKFSLIAAQRNVNVIAIDIDSQGLKKLRSKNNSVVVVLADAKSIPLRANLLDATFMMEVLDYIPELETVLAECSRILKSGGSLVFSFGNKSSLKSKLRELQGKHYMHSYRKVVQSLDKAGLRVVKKEGFNWLPFNRTSENPLIPLLAKIEKLFGLRRIHRFSPWVLIHAVRSE
jgi:ubiquinone/menaquinone biosynthesis C-methylase UbiE